MIRNGRVNYFHPNTLLAWPDGYHGWQVAPENLPPSVSENMAMVAPPKVGRKPKTPTAPAAPEVQTGDPLAEIE